MTADFNHIGLALGVGGVLGNTLSGLRTFPPGPLGTFLCGGVALGLRLALLINDILAFNNVILDIVRMLAGDANALGHLRTFLITRHNLISVDTLLDSLLTCHLFVFNEAALFEVLAAFFLLLGLKISGVGGVALLGVAMLALNVVIVLSLLNHDNLVDATITSSSDGTNIQVNVVSFALTRSPGIKVNRLGMVGMVIVVVIVTATVGPSGSIAPSIEGESVDE